MCKSIKSLALSLLLIGGATGIWLPAAQAQEPKAVAVASVAAAMVNLNQADAQTLNSNLKGIGPAKAQAIVEYRTAHGPFKSVDELIEVKGIGAATLERLRPQLTLE